MSEIAKCRCGAEATLNSPCVRGEAPFTHFVDCERCGSSGPNEDSPAEAIAAWNALMRPRPVAEWGAPGGATYLYVGRAVLGYVLTSQSGSESAVCGITGELFRGYDARAWLVERVRAAGFDVEEAKR